MYTVEIKTSQPWQVRKQFVEANRWTVIAKVASQNEAEKDMSWVTHDVQEGTHYLKNFKVEYRIREEQNTVWQNDGSVASK